MSFCWSQWQTVMDFSHVSHLGQNTEISHLVIQTHSHTTLKSPCTETKCLNEKDVW